MGALGLLFIGLICFVVAYKFYGDYLDHKVMGIKADAQTPAHAMYDGSEYVPASAPVLLGHHFASIAGAGPITGPIAAAAFGWVPVALWIIGGSVFFGGVHDYSSLLASSRHEGKSIGEIVRRNVGERAQVLFLLFSWLTLLLVVSVFTILTRDVFVSIPEVATTSILFIILAIIFGLAIYRMKLPLGITTVAGVALLILCIYIGFNNPIVADATTWTYFLLAYIFVASVAPVWILLQPRDYLNSFLLYALLIGGLLGIIVGRPSFELPAFTSFDANGYLFPMLFVTVACGAISGFHSLVSSGTTSKQLNNEKDARLIGYGGMLIEGLLALIALSTAAILTTEGYSTTLAEMGGPTGLFSQGIGTFLSYLGIPMSFGVVFGGLALNAFCLTSLDTATRLARYAFQEFFETRVPALTNKYIATLVGLVLAGALALSGNWSAIWPIFGSANQLLAGLALLSVSVWLMRRGRDYRATFYPMVFMLIVTLTALYFLIRSNLAAQNYVLGIPGLLLFVLAIFLVVETYNIMKSAQKEDVKA
ncbi:MAG TPA: carbon starvation protein A [Firmicutes bacterium]|nr:carbon starvation protein A [Bacillota bacterium]